jgi:cation diffusion facilitator family transporter
VIRHRRSGGREPEPGVGPGRDPGHGHGEHGHGDHGHGHGEHGHGDHGHGHGEHGHGHGDHGHGGGLGEFLRSLARPHNHDHAGAVDAALTTSDDGMRALALSLAGLAATALIELVVVLASGSVALLSDTIHNFADALTAVPLGLAFWVGRRPPTPRYTYGYGRHEDLAGIFIVVTIAASSVLAAWQAVARLVHPRPVDHVGWVIVAGLVGFAGNELVAAHRVRVGRRIGSAALVADGLHARTDGFTSLAVVLGAIGVAAGWALADPIAGLAITLAILVVLKDAGRDAYRRLMDGVDPALVAQVDAVLERIDGIDRVDAVRIRWVGHELHAEAEVTSNGGLTLSEAHAVGEHAHHHLLHAVPRLAHATIHTSPTPHAGEDPHAVTAHHFRDRRAAGHGVGGARAPAG